MKQKSQNSLKKFLKENQKERFRFINQWADYVRTHSDRTGQHSKTSSSTPVCVPLP